MYRKITHNIVEEHYGEPGSGLVKVTRSEIPNNETFNETQFRSDVQNYVHTYANNLNQLIDSMKSPDNSLVTAFENFFANGFVDVLGNMTKPFINSELAEKLNVNFRSIVINTIMSIHNVKMGLDYGYFKNKIGESLAGMNNDMRNYNSEWATVDSISYFRPILDDIFNKINARYADNDQASAAFGQKIYDEFTQLGTHFAEGLIRRYPGRFYQPTVPTA
jgi:hypothetical protein